MPSWHKRILGQCLLIKRWQRYSRIRREREREAGRKPQAACTWLLGIYIHHPFRATALQAKSPLVLQALDACARVHARFYVSRQSAYTRASRAYSSRAHTWNETGTWREEGRWGGRGSEENEEEGEKETKGRRELRCAVIRDRVRRGRTWTFFSMCAQESSLPSTSRFNRSPNKPPLVTYTEVPFYSVSFSSSYFLAWSKFASIGVGTEAFSRAVLTSPSHIFLCIALIKFCINIIRNYYVLREEKKY